MKERNFVGKVSSKLKLTSGPASAQASSDVNRTTESAGSSSDVTTIVVISRTRVSVIGVGSELVEENRFPTTLVTPETVETGD